MSYTVQVSGPASRSLGSKLPPDVALACLDFIQGPLAVRPYRVGKQLGPPFKGEWSARVAREYRVRYEILEHSRTVMVNAITHRGHAYRSPEGKRRRR